MSEAEEQVKISGLSSSAAIDLYELIAEQMRPEQLVGAWNGLLRRQAKRTVRIKNPSTKSRVNKFYTILRNELWKCLEPRLDGVAEQLDSGEIRLTKPVQQNLPLETLRDDLAAALDKVEADEVKKAVVHPAATMPPKTKKASVQPVAPAVSATKLSSLEKSVLKGSLNSQTVTKVFESFPTMTEEDKQSLSRAAEELDAAQRKREAFVEWACRLADSQADKLKTLVGQQLWDNAVTVESHPADPMQKVVFVRSSTAPFHGVSVKCNFRAYGKHVDTKHDQMFRQLDGYKLIRSRIIKEKMHEYYVKGLEYKEGMYLKEYFVVEGELRDELSRYFVIRDGAVVEITVQEYRDHENRAAAKATK